MNKKIVVTLLSTLLASGCSVLGGDDTVSYKDLKQEGNDLYKRSIVVNTSTGDSGSYVPSVIPDVEIVRTTINTLFLTAKPTYEEYINKIMTEPSLNNYFSAVESVETDEEKRAIYDALTVENKKLVDDFNNSSMTKEIMSNLGDASITALNSFSQFKQIDTTSLLASLDFKDMLSEKDKLALTLGQMSYLNDSIISAYDNYKIISAFRQAQ